MSHVMYKEKTMVVCTPLKVMSMFEEKMITSLEITMKMVTRIMAMKDLERNF